MKYIERTSENEYILNVKEIERILSDHAFQELQEILKVVESYEEMNRKHMEILIQLEGMVEQFTTLRKGIKGIKEMLVPLEELASLTITNDTPTSYRLLYKEFSSFPINKITKKDTIRFKVALELFQELLVSIRLEKGPEEVHDRSIEVLDFLKRFRLDKRHTKTVDRYEG